MDSIIKVCPKNKIPIYPGEVDSVRKGEVTSLALNYYKYKLNHQTRAMAAKIIIGQAKSLDPPMETPKDTTPVINSKTTK